MGKDVPQEVHPAALPAGAQHLGDGGLDALVGIGDDQLHAPEPAPCQLAQEGRPDGRGIRGFDIYAQSLAPAVAVDARGDDDGDRDDTPAAADFQVGGVDPKIRSVALDWPHAECLHPGVDLLAQPPQLAPGVAAQPHGLHQIIDRAGSISPADRFPE